MVEQLRQNKDFRGRFKAIGQNQENLDEIRTINTKVDDWDKFGMNEAKLSSLHDL